MLALSLLLSIPIARAADQTTIEGITLTEKWNFSKQRGNFSNSGWLAADSRDLAFWNGELIALTTSGNLSRVKVATGEKIGDISTNGVSGGSLKLTSIVAVKGKLYGCNLGGSSDANKFKIYRWDNVNSDPVLVYEGTTPNGQPVGRKMGVHNNHLMLTNAGTHLYRIPVNDDGSLGAVKSEPYPQYGDIKISGDGSAIAIASVESITSARFIMSAPYGTDEVKVKAEGGGGVGNIRIAGTALVNPKRVPAMQVINFKGKKILAAIDYTTAGSFKCPVLKFLVKTGDLTYTNNGNQLPAQALETTGNEYNGANVAAVEYQVRDNGETLDVVFLVPNLGAAMFSTKIQENKAATNFKLDQAWSGENQKATFSWTPGENIDHYTIRVGSSSSDFTSILSSPTGNAATVTAEPISTGLGYKKVYELTSWATADDFEGHQATGKVTGTKVGTSCYVSQYDLDFGSVKLKAELNGTTATLSWDGPANGKVSEYQLIEYRRITSHSGASRVEEKVLNTYDANTHSATVSNFVLQKEENGETVHTSFYVKAIMTISITTTENETRNYVISNTALPIEAGKPAITNIQVYEGRTTATLEWEFPGIPEHRYVKYYEVFRNGVRIQPAYESGKLSDMNLPDGKHTYYVIAHVFDRENDANEVTAVSNTVTCTISRNRLVTGYGLQEIYNYPIMTPEEYAAHGNPADAVVAAGPFANAKDKVGAYGAPGDAFRQAQFYNGYWYLACLTSASATDDGSGNKYIPNSWTTDAELQKNFGDVRGGILKIGARGTEGIEDPHKLKDHTWAELEVNYTWPLENQSVAISEDGRIYRRGLGSHPANLSNNGPLHATAPACDLFYLPWKYVCQPEANGLAGRSDIDLTSYTFDRRWVGEGQVYRTHYISAGGNSANGTDYLLFAMNSTRDVWRVLPNGTATQFTAPIPATAIDTKCTSTENYAFPVVGRGGDFIHQVRGEGLYYVNAATGEYTTVYSKNTDVSNSGGVTFKYNDEIFLLHPISTRSNNVGHFSIDMARKYNDNPDQASFAEMIPVAAFMQVGMSDFMAGNSNANWFGAEYNEADDCIYIYQYVPGVRFAKYRFYKYLDFPGVKPELDIQVVESPKANGSGDEVELLTAVATWQRPSEKPVNEGGDGYRPDLPNTEYLIGEYEVEFLDNNNAPYAGNDWNKKLYDANGYTSGDPKDKDPNTSYNDYYGKDAAGKTTQKNLKAVSHTVRVTPIYHKKFDWDVKVRGEGNIAIASADYPAGIYPLTVRAYAGTKNGQGYRVDFDFNRAPMVKGKYPHHVSFFTIEVSKDNGQSFQKLKNFYFIWGNGYHSPSKENFEYVYDNYGRDFKDDEVMKDGAKSYIVDLIPGDYRFGKTTIDGEDLGEENLKDRYYYQKLNGTKNANALNKTFIAPDGTELKECYKGKAAPDAQGECVAYYYTSENPQNYLYRAVAHYAAGNETIHKEAYTTAMRPLDSGTTGVDNIAGDNEGNLSIYPVPAESTVTINAPAGISNVKVFSLSGSLVLDVNGEGNNTQTIDVSMLTPGVYMVAVNSLTPVRMIKR